MKKLDDPENALTNFKGKVVVMGVENMAQMKTNFEKWKETLTPESLITPDGQVGLWCCICPARKEYRKCLACGFTTNCNKQELLDWLNKTERGE